MKVIRVLNNNVVLAQEDHTALLLMGLSIGFKKRPGDRIASSSIEKMFILTNPNTGRKLQEMITFIPEDYFRFSSDAVHHICKRLNKEFQDNLYVMLTDHIYAAVQRYEKGIVLENALLQETKKFYRSEFAVATEIVEQANQQFHVQMSEDEAAFITFHIISAQADHTTASIQEMTRLIQDILIRLKAKYNIGYEEESLSYSRFITHLKYFSQKIFAHKKEDFCDAELFAMVKRKYVQAYEGALDILTLIQKKYGYAGTDMDALYLTIHIARLIQPEKERPEERQGNTMQSD